MKLKRYFLAKTTDVYTVDGQGNRTYAAVGGEFSFIDLTGTGAGNCVVVVLDEHAVPPAAWTEAPHLLSQTPLPANAVSLLSGLGIVTGDTTFTAVMKIAAIHAHFHP